MQKARRKNCKKDVKRYSAANTHTKYFLTTVNNMIGKEKSYYYYYYVQKINDERYKTQTKNIMTRVFFFLSPNPFGGNVPKQRANG